MCTVCIVTSISHGACFCGHHLVPVGALLIGRKEKMLQSKQSRKNRNIRVEALSEQLPNKSPTIRSSTSSVRSKVSGLAVNAGFVQVLPTFRRSVLPPEWYLLSLTEQFEGRFVFVRSANSSQHLFYMSRWHREWPW